jgi:hypothetical protein
MSPPKWFLAPLISLKSETAGHHPVSIKRYTEEFRCHLTTVN